MPTDSKKIIGYIPKTNASKLDLPLLPPPKKEIVGYRIKPNIDKLMVNRILKISMPIWNEEDKSVYFIRGHVAGSLVAKLKELQVLDLWFTPIYDEVESDWVKEHHLYHYYKEGFMSDEMIVEDNFENLSLLYLQKLEEEDKKDREFTGMKAVSILRQNRERLAQMYGFEDGYKAATKVYTEDDLHKILSDFYVFATEGEVCDHITINQFIQMHEQPKSPKWFVAEMEVIGITDDGVNTIEDVKTTTINGKTYLVGKYVND